MKRLTPFLSCGVENEWVRLKPNHDSKYCELFTLQFSIDSLPREIVLTKEDAKLLLNSINATWKAKLTETTITN